MKPQGWTEKTLPDRVPDLGGLIAPRVAWLTVGVLLVVLFATHWSTVLGLVDTWRTSDTYAHGALAIPVAAWLLWKQRHLLADIPLRHSWIGLAALLALSLLWLIGDLASIKSIREFALVASIPVALTAVLGLRFARQAAFPLLFCLFAWPFGEVFIPPMVNATADFTVVALRITGVPVYRDGTSFIIPSGNWSVVEECSGIRYLIVSVFAGTLFAYLTFRSTARRSVFVALSVIVPILANWLRAYGTVLLGHVSGNRIAVGIDHLIYGWLFFGIVMTILFYVGVRWMGEPVAAVKSKESTTRSQRLYSIRDYRGHPWAFLAVGVVVVSLGSVWSWAVASRSVSPLNIEALALPESLGQWSTDKSPIESGAWMPYFEGPDWQAHAVYSEPSGRRLRLHVAVYERQREGAKLVSFLSSALANFGGTWSTLSMSTKVVPDVAGRPLEITERLSSGMSRRVLSWDWSWIEGHEVSTLLNAKLRLLAQRLAFHDEAAVRIVLDTDVVEDVPEAAALLSMASAAARSVPAALVTAARPQPSKVHE